ncbi:Laccase-22 [Hibiscus syriacus]|uniref:laccase n=1 Tax=Hibiscus syriacus TaxID=106335 RepID=A0A6A3BM83_HIBSY|nr:Laccase-22 [Hibiscus syriacus]
MGSWVQTLLFMSVLVPALVECRIRHYHFDVVLKNETKLCSTKMIVTVNGKFPGTTLYAREGHQSCSIQCYDPLAWGPDARQNSDYPVGYAINVQSDSSTSSVSDPPASGPTASNRLGPAYITQCPVQPGQNFLYNFTLAGQRGTLLWHAHISWLRSTMYGAIVTCLRKVSLTLFRNPIRKKSSGMVESRTEAVVNQATQTGLPPNISDAHTINGHPGPVPNCSSDDAYTLHVETGKTYLLRVVNAAVNDELFFKIAYHNLIVVEVDAAYTKPFKTDMLSLGPGQTTTALLKADQGIEKYLIAISPFMDTIVAVETRIGYLSYNRTLACTPTTMFSIPYVNATPVTTVFSNSLRSLNSKEYPANLPLAIDHSLLFIIGAGINPCATCFNGSRAVAAINNVSFVMPTTAILQTHYYGINGVFTDDFPGKPLTPFDYTRAPPSNLQTTKGTKIYKLSITQQFN